MVALMKNMMISILTALLIMAFAQPLLEYSNVLKEKVTLGAAILNSCRSARNNSIVSVDYFDSDMTIGDMNAYIDEDEFRHFFAEAFSDTLRVDVIDEKSNPMRFRANKFWNEITVNVDIENDISDYHPRFSGRSMSKVTVEVRTLYLFRTGLLQAAANTSRVEYPIAGKKVFLVQIIN